MGGGLMQLVAKGPQDKYLTSDNPQITFFKSVYKKHTNFAIESIKQEFDSGVDYGKTCVLTIDRNADLINKMYLEVDISNIDANDEVSANLGTALIDEISIEIGGQTIDTHYGHWLEVWAELTEKNTNYTTSQLSNATTSLHNSGTKFQNLTCSGGVQGQTLTNASGSIDKFFIPLQFWFNRYSGLSLPLVALQYHEVKLFVKFQSEDKVIQATGTSNAANTTLNVNLYSDYIYLDIEERKLFASNEHNYLIEQLQYNKSNSTDTNIELTLNHPVKELIWTGGTSDTAALNDGPTKGPSTPLAITDSNFKLLLNNKDRFKERNLKYFTRLQVWQYHSGCGGFTPGTSEISDSIAVYSFALNPEQYQPSGTCNFSRIEDAFLYRSTGTQELNIYAINYNILKITGGMGGLAYSN